MIFGKIYAILPFIIASYARLK